MSDSLKKLAHDYLEKISLNSEQLKALDNLQEDVEHTYNQVKTPRKWGYAMASMAAIILLTVGFLLPERMQMSDNLVAELAEEVVQNHLHRKPLEVNTNQLGGILAYFTRLDFSPIGSHYLENSGSDLSLIGGRYCSLQGVTAAQLRFTSIGKNEISTLYQVGYDPKTFKQLPDYDQGETPVTTYSNGIKVTLWVEKGVLFGLTEDP